MRERVIVTMVIGEKYKALWEVVRPSFEQYADRISADLMVIESNPHPGLPPHFAKLALHGLLHKKYKRALWLDGDIIIRDDCPDLFEEVPVDKLGVFNEGRVVSRSMALYEAIQVYRTPLPKWDRRSYYNTGVMVVGSAHRHLFANPEFIANQVYNFGEQTYLNLQIFKKEIPVHELSHRFNRMSVMDSITGTSRLSCFIVHYAGNGYSPGGGLETLIKDDLRRWDEDRPSYTYRPTLFLHVGGGLGDQVCAEPVLRYIHDVLYTDADLYVTTAYPELFTHLERLKVSKVPWTGVMVDAVHRMELHPSQNTGHGKYTLNILSHPVDYISMEALERTLPASAKQIHLPNSHTGINEGVTMNNLVLVHPGAGWPSKTFPKAWWQSVIDNLAGSGHRVGIIGRDLQITDNRGISHGYVPIEVPPGGVDFRDQLSTEDLMGLIKISPVLISNDSAPIHIAGAYDNWIILIPTCKHPEHLLPYRHGSQWYKAAALYRSLACEEYGFRPTDMEARSVSHTINPIETYLPDPSEVVAKVNEIMNRSVGNYHPLPTISEGVSHEYHAVQPN